MTEPGATKIAKVDEDEQLVFGWAYVSTGADGDLIVDSDGESIEPHELEKAAYDYVLEAREAGEMHEGEPLGKMIESLVVTPEKAGAMGLPPTEATGWWVGFHIEDADAFAKVKNGEYAMFSVQGFGEMKEVEA